MPADVFSPNRKGYAVAITAGFTLQYGSYMLELLKLNEQKKMNIVAAKSAAANLHKSDNVGKKYHVMAATPIAAKYATN